MYTKETCAEIGPSPFFLQNCVWSPHTHLCFLLEEKTKPVSKVQYAVFG